MLLLSLALQLAVVQMQPVTSQRIYDVDLEIFRGVDTVAMPLLRLADGLEGRLMLSPARAPSLLLRATVLRERASSCHLIRLQISQLIPRQGERDFVPAVSGRLCGGVERIRLTGEGDDAGSLQVMARVRALPVITLEKPER